MEKETTSKRILTLSAIDSSPYTSPPRTDGFQHNRMEDRERSDDNHRKKRNRQSQHEMPPPAPIPAPGPLRSVEGWVIFVTGIHEEAEEEDIREVFCDYGRIKSIVLNADRKTGVPKGYALVEFLERDKAQDAINALHGKKLLGKRIGVHWAFCKSNTPTR